MLDKGHGVREVTRIVGAASGTVTRWQQVYEKRSGTGVFFLTGQPGRRDPVRIRQGQRGDRLRGKNGMGVILFAGFPSWNPAKNREFGAYVFNLQIRDNLAKMSLSGLRPKIGPKIG